MTATNHYNDSDSDSQEKTYYYAPSEKHLEDWIVANQQEFFAKNPRVWGRRIAARQVQMGSGRLDLVVAAKLGLRILELKKETVDEKCVTQVIRYTGEVRDLFRWAEHLIQSYDDPHYYEPSPATDMHPLVAPVLIGGGFTRKALLACATNDIIAIEYWYDGETYEFEEVSESVNTDYSYLMDTELGAAIKEVLRHRRLLTEDIESLKAIYREEGSL